MWPRDLKSVEEPGLHVCWIAGPPDGRTYTANGFGKPIPKNLPAGEVQASTPLHHPVCFFELATGRLVRALNLVRATMLLYVNMRPNYVPRSYK